MKEIPFDFDSGPQAARPNSVERRIFDAIDADILRRKGIGEAWGEIDDVIMWTDIQPTWEKIILREIAKEAE